MSTRHGIRWQWVAERQRWRVTIWIHDKVHMNMFVEPLDREATQVYMSYVRQWKIPKLQLVRAAHA